MVVVRIFGIATCWSYGSSLRALRALRMLLSMRKRVVVQLVFDSCLIELSLPLGKIGY